MLKIPFPTWIANAAAGLTGLSGDVTRPADVADGSRQTIDDHTRKVQAAVEDAHDGGPTRAESIERNQDLRQEDAQLRAWLAQTVEFPPEKPREFTVTATAMGLSLTQTLVLLKLIPGKHAGPARSALHRGTKRAARAATRALRSLDAQGKALLPVGCLDEIFFHGRPVLVGVAPASMTWFLGQKANDRSGATRAKALRAGTALSDVTADAAPGLPAGIAAVPQERQEQGEPPWEDGRDVFHTTHEARRVLRQSWSHGDRCGEQAEAATRRVEQAQRQGQDARGVTVAARPAWKKAEAAVAQYERSEAGWKMAPGARSVVRPEGHWNDRAWAEQQIALAPPLLSGREWSKVRGFLQAKETLTFLGRLHRQLRQTVPCDRLRAELVRLWWLRRRRPRANTPVVVVGAGPGAHRVQQVVCQEVDATWREASAAVSRVLRLTVRASSAVECMNGVLRMHQSRHTTVTQGLLDLKRLYGNCRACRGGKRRGRCPYEHLGLKLPSYRSWDLLWMPIPAAEAI
jgi:hypothetical protein